MWFLRPFFVHTIGFELKVGSTASITKLFGSFILSSVMPFTTYGIDVVDDDVRFAIKLFLCNLQVNRFAYGM